MKRVKKVISMLLAAQLSFLSVFCVASAREKIVDEDFDTGYTAGQGLPNLQYAGVSVTTGIANAGSFTLDRIPGTENMAVKSYATEEGKRNIFYIFPGKQVLDKTMDFWSVSFRMRVGDGENWVIDMKDGTNGWGAGVLKGWGAENRISPFYSTNWSGNSAHRKNWTPNEFFTVKIIFDMKNKMFDYYLNGRLVGDDCLLRQDVDWGSAGAFYMTICLDGRNTTSWVGGTEHSLPPTSAENPSTTYIDNLQIYSYQKNEMEVYPTPDCFCAPLPYTGADRDLPLVESMNDASGRTRLGLDFINRSGAEKPLCIAVATYEKDAEGFSRLLDVKLQNTVLPAGISQVFTPGFNLEKGEGTAERFVKVFTWDAFDQLLPYNGFLQLTAK